MPTGIRKTVKTHRYHGTVAEQFDMIDAIGSKVLEAGERIRKAAIHFPITAEWVVSDLEDIARFAAGTARKLRTAMEADDEQFNASPCRCGHRRDSHEMLDGPCAVADCECKSYLVS